MKKSIIIIGGLIIALALVVSIVQWNQDVATTAEKAKEDLTTVTEKDPVESENPASDDSGAETNTPDPEQKNPSQSEAVQKQQVAGQKGSGSNGTPSDDYSSPEKANKSLSEIKTAYRAIVTDLEVQETSKLDQLIVKAKADHVSGKYNKDDLIDKYSASATTLEGRADQLFNAIYTQLEKDLSQNGYDTNEALEFRNEYNSKKQARLNHMLDQLEDF